MAWNRPSGGIKFEGECGQRQVNLKGLIAACIAIFGVVIVVFFLWSPDDGAAVSSKPSHLKKEGTNGLDKTSLISDCKSNVIGKAAGKTSSHNTTNVEVTAKSEKKPGVFAPGMIRLPNGLELRFKLPAEGETRQVLAGGKIWEIDSKGNIVDITPPPIFEKPFEGMLSALFERDGLVLPFQLKQYSEKEVRKMCKEPTLSYEDDTPEITAKRENVVMLKKAVLDFLDAGGKFEEFVDDMAKHSQNASIAQVTGVRDIHDLLANGKDHEALQYYKAFSEEMVEKGYGELSLPRAFKDALEEQQKLEDAKR